MVIVLIHSKMKEKKKGKPIIFGNKKKKKNLPPLINSLFQEE